MLHLLLAGLDQEAVGAVNVVGAIVVLLHREVLQYDHARRLRQPRSRLEVEQEVAPQTTPALRGD